MPEPILAAAERGTHRLLEEAERMLERAQGVQGPSTLFSYVNTLYYLPIALGSAAKAVEKLRDLDDVLEFANQTGDPDLATLLAAETVEAVHAPDGQISGPISDAQVRALGIRIADGRIPAVAIVLGNAGSSMEAAALIRELRSHNVLCFLSGGIIAQLKDAGPDLDDGGVLRLGSDSRSAVHGLGFVARCAMQLGGLKPGAWSEIQEFGMRRVPGFIVALGEIDEQARAIAQAAECFDFPTILAGGADSQDESAQHLVERCFSARGIQPKVFPVNIPTAYGPAFEEEAIEDAEMRVQFGGAGNLAFQLLEVAGDVTDGWVRLIGPELPEILPASSMDLGLIVRVSGPALHPDFEQYLERQIGPFLNFAHGVRHAGSQDHVVLRISKEAAAKGVGLESLGKILCTRFRQEFAPSVEKVEVLIVTERQACKERLDAARATYERRTRQLAELDDSQVDEFYTCVRCRAFRPDNVCFVSPERGSPCGDCNWLDAKAMFTLRPGGLRRPIRLGKLIDGKRGIWEGTNEYARAASHGRVNEISMYSIMQSPLGACGAFECIVMLIPEANGVMVVSRDDTSLTPAGIGMDTLASLAAGEQTPGVMGIARNYLLSSRFIAAEGGLKRVVWMSSRLKDAMAKELGAVCSREGDPKLMDKIADERSAGSVAELLAWMKQHKHPALNMEKMF